MKIKTFDKLRSRKGYSLAEILMTVAIIVVLCAITIGSVVAIQRNLRQKELDAKAETIYEVAQNQLSSLYANGKEAAYKIDNTTVSTSDPSQMEGKLTLTKEDGTSKSLTFISHGTQASDHAYQIMGSSAGSSTNKSLDDELYDAYWVVEYNPKTATVYAVYYSEDINVADEYIGSISGGSATDAGSLGGDYQSYLRTKTNRIIAGAKIGYYGGSGNASSGEASTLKPSISINNAETLTAKITCKNPKWVTAGPDLVFKVTVSDTNGHYYTKYYTKGTNTDLDNPDGYDVDIKSLNSAGKTYTLNLTLDDLSSASTRFYKLYGQGASGRDESEKLDCGTELTVEVEVSCPGYTDSELYGYVAQDTNSLFADDSTSTTAVVTYGRHLQNVDLETSHVTPAITAVKQESNINFADDETDKEDWYSVYTKKFFNGTVTGGNPNFKSITNGNIRSFTGATTKDDKVDKQYYISGLITTSDSDTGLFSSVLTYKDDKNVNVHQTLTFENVRLTGTTSTSYKNAGTLVGSIESACTVTIKNSQAYLSEANGDLKNIDDTIRFVTGTYTSGGLVGSNEGTLNIEQSSSSTLLGNNVTGGLVGDNSGTVNIEKSYADSYLFGKEVGGLVGYSTGHVSIKGSYVAGYIGLLTSESGAAVSSYGAGFANGKVDELLNSYTIISRYGVNNKGGLDLDNSTAGNYSSTASSITSAQNVYYRVRGNENLNQTKRFDEDLKPEEMNAKFEAGTFVTTTCTTQPYKLLKQSLSTYMYPHIDTLNHYGDWEAEFQSGGLVYYEEYSDETFGFEGANVYSSLKDQIVIGDGYGIVFKDDDNTRPSSVVVKIGDDVFTMDITDNKTDYYTVKKDDTTYRIYPLSKDKLNNTLSSNTFYTRVTVTSEDEKTYYDFNPHFAKTVIMISKAEDAASQLTKDSVVYIRSARQLYNLSLNYSKDGANYRSIVSSFTLNYRQECDISYSDYDWDTFYTESGINKQAPIGSSQSTSFKDIYDGQNHQIQNVSIVTKSGNYVGLFGYNTGTIKNVVLSATYSQNGSTTYRSSRTDTISGTVYIGTLAGYNGNIISNCAATGYYLSGSDGTIHAYSNSTVFVGGFVGYNTGSISNSEADNPKISLSLNYARSFTGGFTGSNAGTIRDSYALGQIEVTEARGGTTNVAGFAARNNGMIYSSYCATAMTVSGDNAKVYGFSVKNGYVSNDCYYLNGGTYTYVKELKAYNYDTSISAGSGIVYNQLTANGGNAVNSYKHNNTTTTTGVYPFRAVMTNSEGYVHYGDWQDDPLLNDTGIFYWEHEVGGTNAGYHLTYIGVSSNGSSTSVGTTLCNSHNDGGVITEYGYGYFSTNEMAENITMSTSNGLKVSSASYNTAASQDLHNQIPEYTFHAYTTRLFYGTLSGGSSTTVPTVTSQDKASDYSDYMYLESGTNGTMTVNGKAFTISPYFANAMSYGSASTLTGNDGLITNYATTPGTSANSTSQSGNPYEIRSYDQLQAINWNVYYKICNFDYGSCSKQGHNSGNANDWDTNFVYASASKYYFSQSHDLEAIDATSKTRKSFVSIGQAGLRFKGYYDGQSYTVKNLYINSSSQFVGLFGEMGDNSVIKNVVLYAEKGSDGQSLGKVFSTYAKDTSTNYEPAIGTLVGMAWQPSNAITNCASSGYEVGYNGESNTVRYITAGGLVGSFFGGSITNCSAVNDVVIKGNNAGKRAQIGGLIGTTSGSTVKNCYTGGTLNCENTQYQLYGGIAGNNNGHSGSSNLENNNGSTSISNCYTYVKVPQSNTNGTRNNKSVTLNGTYYIAGNDYNSNISNCYFLKYTGNAASSDSATGLTYAQMTTDSTGGTLLTDLKGKTNKGSSLLPYGSGFSNVTVTEGENDAPVNGKYSFGNGLSYLEGKDYPFAAVVQQKDVSYSTGTNEKYVYVHYGEWPMNGSYWQDGRVTMDIFEDMDEDGWTYGTFTLINNSGLDKDSFDSSYFTYDSSLVEFVSAEQNDEDSNYTVVFKIKNEGTSTITFKDPNTNTEADFTLGVTAELNITYSPQNWAMRNGETKDLTLYAKTEENREYQVNEHSTWTVTPKEEKVDITDTEAKNVKTVTSYGFDDFADIVLDYDYNGTKFTFTTLMEITNVHAIGLSNNDKLQEDPVFNEVNTTTHKTGTDFVGENTELDSKYAPYADGYNVFLYETNGTDILADGTIESISYSEDSVNYATLTDAGNGTYIDDYYYLSLQDVVGDSDSVYMYRYGTIYKKGNTDTTHDITLRVVVSKDGKTYTLQVPVNGVEEQEIKSVTLRPNNGEADSVYYFVKGTEFELPTPSIKGYTFNGWKDEDATVYDPNAILTVDKDYVLDAQWTATQYRILYCNVVESDEEDENENPNKDVTSYTIEDTIELKDAEAKGDRKDHYSFGGWYISSTFQGTPITQIKNSTGDLRLYAKWVAESRSITYNGNGGTVDGETEKTEEHEYGTVVVLPEAQREGYTCTGWKDTDGNVYEVGDQITLKTNMTLKAQWSVNTYKITYVTNGGTITSGDENPSEFTIHDLPKSLATVENGSMRFGGWYTTEDFKKNTKVTSINEIGNVTLYAQWINKYTIHLVYTSVSTYEIEPDASSVGTSYSAPGRKGWSLDGWYIKGSNTKVVEADGSIPDSTLLTNNAYYYAKWTTKKYSRATTIEDGKNYILATAINSNTASIVSRNGTSVSVLSADNYDCDGTYIYTTDTSAEWMAETDYGTYLVNDGYYLKRNSNNVGLTKNYWEYSNINNYNGRIYSSGSRSTYYLVSSGNSFAFATNSSNYVYLYEESTDTDVSELKAKVTFKDGTTTVLEESVDVGTSVTTPTRSKDGYTFDGWKVNDTTYAANTNVEITEDTTFVAQWTPIKYTISFNANNGKGTMSDISMKYGDMTTLPANGFTRTGYTFTGWNTQWDGKGTGYAAGTTVSNLTKTDGGKVTLYAQWTPDVYTVTYEGVSSTEHSNPTTFTYETALPITLTGAKNRTGYTFDGWYSDAAYTNKVTELTKHESATVYAKYIANTHTVTLNEGHDGQSSTITVTYDQKYGELPTPTWYGHTFLGWASVDGGTVDVTKDTIVTKDYDHSLYAQWGLKTMDVTFDANGGSVTPTSKSVTYSGTYGELPTPTRTGYTFTGWYTEGGNLVTSTTVVSEESAHTLYAHWQANTYTVTFNKNKGTGTAMSDLTMTYDQSQNLTANSYSRKGYEFAGWNTKEDGSGSSYDDKASVSNLSSVQGDTVTLYAQWTAHTYTVKFLPNGGTGTMDDQSMTYDSGEKLSKNTFTRKGYEFAGWNKEADGSGTSYTDEQQITDQLTSDDKATVKLYAQWQLTTYKISYELNGGTKGEGNYPDEYQITTDDITLDTPSKLGYTFDGWYTSEGFEEGTKVEDNVFDTDYADDVTLYAKWTANTDTAYKVEYYQQNINNDNYTLFTTVDKTGTTDTNATAEQVTYAGFTFDDDNASNVKEGNIAGDGSLVLKMYYNRNSYDVTYSYTNTPSDATALPATSSVRYGAEVTVATNATATGYTFSGWSTTDATINDGKFTMPDNAVSISGTFSANTYTIHFDANGGSGTQMADETMTYDVSIALTKNTYSRDGYVFKGWATKATGDVKYTDEESVKNLAASGTKTLYAVWYQKVTVYQKVTSWSDITNGNNFVLAKDISNNSTTTVNYSETTLLANSTTVTSKTGTDGTTGYVFGDGVSKWQLNTTNQTIKTSDGSYYLYGYAFTRYYTEFKLNSQSSSWNLNNGVLYVYSSVLRNNYYISCTDDSLTIARNTNNAVYIYQPVEIEVKPDTIEEDVEENTNSTQSTNSKVTDSKSSSSAASFKKKTTEKTQVSTPKVTSDTTDVYYGTDHNLNSDPFTGSTDSEKVSQRNVSFNVDSDASTYVLTWMGASRGEYDYLVGKYSSYDALKEAIKKYTTLDPNLYHDSTNNYGEIKLEDSTLSWYYNRDQKFVLYNVPNKDLDEESQILNYIYLEKSEDGYDVFVDSSDTRVTFARNKEHVSKNSKNSYYLGTISKDSDMVLPFFEELEMGEDDNTYYNHSQAILRYEGKKITLVLNDKNMGDFTSQVSIQAKSDTLKDSEIVNVNEEDVKTIERSDLSATISSIDDVRTGNKIKITSKYEMVMQITYTNKDNEEVVEYISSSATKKNKEYTNEFVIPKSLMTKEITLKFAEIVEHKPENEQDKLMTNSLSKWSEAYDVDFTKATVKQLTATTYIYSGGNALGYPTFDETIWISKNPYSNGNMGQCTWFAWARFYEIYGYSPGFTGNGYECVGQLVAAHPDLFYKDTTPVVGSVFSADAKHNHVGIVVAVNGDQITVQEGNLDGVSNDWDKAKVDWQQVTYTLSALRGYYGKVTFANPKTPPTSAVTSATSAIGSRYGTGDLITYSSNDEEDKDESKDTEKKSDTSTKEETKDKTSTETDPETTPETDPVEDPTEPTEPSESSEKTTDPTDPSESEEEPSGEDEDKEDESEEEEDYGWTKIEDKWYYIDKDTHEFLKGKQIIDDVEYEFDENGVLLTHVEEIEAQYGPLLLQQTS